MRRPSKCVEVVRPYDVLLALCAGAVLALIASVGQAAPNCQVVTGVSVVAPGVALGAPWGYAE